MPVKTLNIPKESPLHRDLVKKLDGRIQLAKQGHQQQHDKWIKAEEITLAFTPETTEDSARRARRDGGLPSYTTIQIPYSFGLLMSAHTYWTSVFFARSPVHQFSGRHGEGEMQVQAMEALIGYQVEVGQMMAPYYIWLYDAAKYGCGIVGHYWDRQKLHYGQIVEMIDPETQKPTIYQTTQEVEGYVGNCVYNVSPWDFMHDPRVPLKEFQKGEFCCARKRLGWSHILRRKDNGYFNDNISLLKDHVSQQHDDSEGSDQLIRPQFHQTLYDDETDRVGHPAGATFWEVYVELVPREWGIGSTSFPQKWCFTITEDRGLIVGASPLGYIHCQFPFDVTESEVEGYGLYARGIPEIMAPVQNTIDWLLNTHFFNVRAALNNQFIVDPSKLVVKDVQNSGPGFIWRLRPEAYGTDIRTMFTQVQVQDVTRAHLQDFQAMLGIGERTLGVSDAIMGMMNQGGRKTATETRISTGFGVNRLKTITEYMSAAAFAPHAQKLVQTSQQYYDAQAKLRRVGSFALDAGMGFINVSPQDIVGFYDLVPIDGNLPIDRMAQANLWKEIMGNIAKMPPNVMMSFDWGRIFAWMAQIAGLKNINQFKVELMPDAQLQQQAQLGNVIPMPSQRALPKPGGSPVQPGQSASTAAGLNALGSGGSSDAGY